MPVDKKWAPPALQVLIMAAACAGLIPLVSPVMAITGGVETKLLFLGRILLLVLIAYAFLRLRGLGLADIGFRKIRWSRFALAALGGFVASMLAVGVLAGVLLKSGAPPATYAMFKPLAGDLPLYLFFLIPVSWGSAAFGEEFIFRGFFLQTLERVLGGARWYATLIAVVLQAALFGLLHLYQGPAGAANTAAIGLVLGFVWWVSGRNLWACILIHGLVDTASMTVLFMGAAH